MIEKRYMIRRVKDGYYYSGHNYNRFTKHLNQAKIYKTPQTAIKFYFFEHDFSNTELIEVNIEIPKEGLLITDELLETNGNDYYVQYKKLKKVE